MRVQLLKWVLLLPVYLTSPLISAEKGLIVTRVAPKDTPVGGVAFVDDNRIVWTSNTEKGGQVYVTDFSKETVAATPLLEKPIETKFGVVAAHCSSVDGSITKASILPTYIQGGRYGTQLFSWSTLPYHQRKYESFAGWGNQEARVIKKPTWRGADPGIMGAPDEKCYAVDYIEDGTQVVFYFYAPNKSQGRQVVYNPDTQEVISKRLRKIGNNSFPAYSVSPAAGQYLVRDVDPNEGGGGKIKLFDLADDTRALGILDLPEDQHNLARVSGFSRYGLQIAVGTSGGDLYVQEAGAAHRAHSISWAQESEDSASISAVALGARYLYAMRPRENIAQDGDLVRVWDLRSTDRPLVGLTMTDLGLEAKEYDADVCGGRYCPQAIMLSPNEKRLVINSCDETVLCGKTGSLLARSGIHLSTAKSTVGQLRE